jgi:hypothetical protein
MLRAQLPCELDPVVVAEAHVEQQEVDLVRSQELPHVLRRPGLEHAVALELEIEPHKHAKRGVVVPHGDDRVRDPGDGRTVTAYDPRRMERTVRGGERLAYTAAVTDLWERVGTALTRLERIAEGPPDDLVDAHVDELPGLQYSLHAGAELALGIDAPPTAASLHAELVAALGEARDATAEVAYAIDNDDPETVEALLPEWRGTLFRVRLARLRVLERSRAAGKEQAAAREEPPTRRREHAGLSAVVATVLILGGAFLFTAGAVLVAWPVWAAGLALFAGGFVLYRP